MSRYRCRVVMQVVYIIWNIHCFPGPRISKVSYLHVYYENLTPNCATTFKHFVLLPRPKNVCLTRQLLSLSQRALAAFDVFKNRDKKRGVKHISLGMYGARQIFNICLQFSDFRSDCSSIKKARDPHLYVQLEQCYTC